MKKRRTYCYHCKRKLLYKTEDNQGKICPDCGAMVDYLDHITFQDKNGETQHLASEYERGRKK